ncbi:type VI secretion system protein TssL [Pseudorhodobacter sp. E13]|uniref:type VI secretion system protein TssL, long form n=1 Tax=Pseudorhodobacter sp. E13 TaxID=2487931 RepID=UPI000F8EE39E|nr:type VI secretion system protein TssL, long form [Pseudorhodobacter sp. E13]RUS59696.1 type VI secretion system protein TssL [Pseudorhodobacter sp. E13]
MSNNDPFAEPDDSERTVIRPNPAGRRPGGGAGAGVPTYGAQAGAQAPAAQGNVGYGVPQAAAAPVAADSGKTAESPIALAMTGMNRLNAAAATLFALVSRIRNRAQHMEPETLRRNVVAEIRGFETRAIQGGVDPQQVKVARYAICATIDDVVLNTPWGEQSIWGMQSMVGTFHRETVGGDRFYDVLARLEQDPPNNIELLEFMYMCLSLGFDGRLRVEQGGADKHLQIRNGLARIIRAQRGPVEQDLSPHWQGVDRPHKALSVWKPVYIAVGAIAALLTVTFGGISIALGGQTERLLGQLASVDPGRPPVLERPAPPPPPPTPPPGPSQVEVVSGFLEKEITAGTIKVFEDANTLTVRINGNGMFGSGSDRLAKEVADTITRLTKAMDDQVGKIIVVGHSDNVPIKSSRFPSNMHLSLARAESVKKSMETHLKDPSRISAEGRSDKEPLESNATAEGRAANRRIEIVLLREES